MIISAISFADSFLLPLSQLDQFQNERKTSRAYALAIIRIWDALSKYTRNTSIKWKCNELRQMNENAVEINLKIWRTKMKKKNGLRVEILEKFPKKTSPAESTN